MTDKEKYPDFIKTTGYGEIQGLLGINCRHYFYPYFGDGDEEILVDKEESARLYELSQEQRALERHVREWKRREVVAQNDDDKLKAQKKVDFWQHKLRNFTKDHKELRRDYLREKIPVKTESNKKYSNFIYTEYYDRNEMTYNPLLYQLEKGYKGQEKDKDDYVNRLRGYFEDYTNENATYNYSVINVQINKYGLEDADAGVKQRAKEMQEAIENNKLEDDIYVYRMVNKEDIKVDTNGKQYIQNKGFTSTSAVKDFETDYQDEVRALKLKIKVDRETPFMYIGNESMSLLNEEEILFGLNTKIELDENVNLKRTIKKYINAKIK